MISGPYGPPNMVDDEQDEELSEVRNGHYW